MDLLHRSVRPSPDLPPRPPTAIAAAEEKSQQISSAILRRFLTTQYTSVEWWCCGMFGHLSGGVSQHNRASYQGIVGVALRLRLVSTMSWIALFLVVVRRPPARAWMLRRPHIPGVRWAGHVLVPLMGWSAEGMGAVACCWTGADNAGTQLVTRVERWLFFDGLKGEAFQACHIIVSRLTMFFDGVDKGCGDFMQAILLCSAYASVSSGQHDLLYIVVLYMLHCTTQMILLFPQPTTYSIRQFVINLIY